MLSERAHPTLALAVALALCGCSVRGTYECGTDTDCAGAGASARCEATRFCSAVDSNCSSGRRYDDYAGGGLGGQCVSGGSGTDAGATDAPQAPGCPAGYLVIGSLPGGYRYVTASSMWLAAETDCENDGSATHLAIIENENENDLLETRLLGTSRAWIGVSDRVAEGSWRTVTNVVQTYLPWGQSEPTGDDDCVAVRETDFADEDCTDIRAYVCECDGVAPVPSSY